MRRFGPHYDETLRRWRTALQARWPEVAQRQFSETVRRKWEYYLASREARLALGQLDVVLLVLQRDSG